MAIVAEQIFVMEINAVELFSENRGLVRRKNINRKSKTILAKVRG